MCAKLQKEHAFGHALESMLDEALSADTNGRTIASFNVQFVTPCCSAHCYPMTCVVVCSSA